MSSAEFIRSSLRLFLSVDIVGSTAYKHRGSKGEREDRPRQSEQWLEPFVNFYREVERELTATWRRVPDSANWPKGEAPQFWKSAGDELIYSKVLTDHREALTCVQAWMEAINRFRLTFRRNWPSLDLKSTAWTAGFPVHNAEVFFRSSVSDATASKDDDDPIYSNLALQEKYYALPLEGSALSETSIRRDFVGPAMDTGFRLSSFSAPRKLVISIDLALILVHAVRAQSVDDRRLKFHFDDRISLKGVFGGVPYPIFWIDMQPTVDLHSAEDALTGRGEIDTDRVLNFCEAFIKDNSAFLFRPYIIDNRDGYFSDMPPQHAERLGILKKYWLEETQRRRYESEAASKLSEPAQNHGEFEAFLAKMRSNAEPSLVARPSEFLERLRSIYAEKGKG